MSFSMDDKDVGEHIVASGYEIGVVYDIGGSNGAWTCDMRPVFPTARFELFEPLGEHEAEYRAGLQTLQATDPNVGVHILALGAEDGEADIRVFPNRVGSTMLPGDGGQPILKTPRRSIDSLIRDGMPCPDLIKADTQGGEFDIIRGAEENLKRVSFLLLETWLIRGYGAPTPLLIELIDYLRPRGFIPFDFGGVYRDETRRLFAQDVWFINLHRSNAPAWHYSGVLNG